MGTIQFTGEIVGIGVQVLVDGGSFDNFLQPRIAHFLKLPVEPILNANVLVGNGELMTVEGLVTSRCNF